MWLFTRLAREIATHIVADRGPEELLRRLSDRSGSRRSAASSDSTGIRAVTTTVTGALKEGRRGIEHGLDVYSQGGKGATSRKTPAEIRDRCERLAIDFRPVGLREPDGCQGRQRCCAGWVPALPSCLLFLRDRSLVQTVRGRGPSGQCWLIASLGDPTQQGMSGQRRSARRYHWPSQTVTSFAGDGPRTVPASAGSG